MAQFGEMYVPGIYLDGPIPDTHHELSVYKLAAKLKEQPTEFEPGSIMPKLYTWAITFNKSTPSSEREIHIQESLKQLTVSADKIGGYDETWNGEWETK